MRLKLKNTPEQIELVKALGSRNANASREAQEAFAAFLGPVIQEVLNVAGTASTIYTNSEFDEDDSPSYPLDLYYNEGAGYTTVWSQNMAGGLPSSQVEGVAEMKIATYRIDSAVSFLKRYARKSRLDVVSKALERMSQEVLLKQERNAWAVILRALAEAKTKTSIHNETKHVLHCASSDGTTDGSGSGANKLSDLKLADFSRLLTRMKRLNESFAQGTPDSVYSNGITDLYVSPELKEKIRSFAYNPMNTKGSVTDIALPDAMREDIYRNAGMQEIYGVNIVELLELGQAKKYNKLYSEFITGQGNGGGYDVSTFSDADDEIMVGVDNSKGAFIRAVARQAEGGATFSALPDDQFNLNRADRAGFYGFMEEGRVCIDGRAVAGMVYRHA
jgi:hypothetical protein